MYKIELNDIGVYSTVIGQNSFLIINIQKAITTNKIRCLKTYVYKKEITNRNEFPIVRLL